MLVQIGVVSAGGLCNITAMTKTHVVGEFVVKLVDETPRLDCNGLILLLFHFPFFTLLLKVRLAIICIDLRIALHDFRSYSSHSILSRSGIYAGLLGSSGSQPFWIDFRCPGIALGWF